MGLSEIVLSPSKLKGGMCRPSLPRTREAAGIRVCGQTFQLKGSVPTAVTPCFTGVEQAKDLLPTGGSLLTTGIILERHHQVSAELAPSFSFPLHLPP